MAGQQEPSSELLAQLRTELRRLHVASGAPSLRDLEKRCGKAVSHSTLGKILKCETVPKWENLDALVHALGGDTDTFRQLWTELRAGLYSTTTIIEEHERAALRPLTPITFDSNSVPQNAVDTAKLEPTSIGPELDENAQLRQALEQWKAKCEVLEKRCEALLVQNERGFVERKERGREPQVSQWNWRPVLLPIAGVIGALLAWYLSSLLFEFNAMVPAPQEVVAGIAARPLEFLQQAWVTVRDALLGFVLGAGCGVLLGSLLGVFTIFRRSIQPMLHLLNAVPTVAIYPMLAFGLGAGTHAKIWFVALMCVFPAMVSTQSGLEALPSDLRELSRSLSASSWQTYLHFRVPAALPQIFVGFKVGIPLALSGAIIVELFDPSEGVGSLIMRSMTTSGRSSDVYGALAMLGFANLALFYSVVLLERLFVPYSRPRSI